MYNKLTIAKNLIIFAKWEFTILRIKNGVEVGRNNINIYYEDNCQIIKKNLDKYNITYTITECIIPDQLMKFNWMEWYGSEDEAILYVNGDEEAKINHLKRMLEMTDYRSIRDTSKYARGVFTPEEKVIYLEFENWRQSCRDEINTLEGDE